MQAKCVKASGKCSRREAEDERKSRKSSVLVVQLFTSSTDCRRTESYRLPVGQTTGQLEEKVFCSRQKHEMSAYQPLNISSWLSTSAFSVDLALKKKMYKT